MGAVGGAVSGGIGEVAGEIAKFGERIVFQMFAHGISQSLLSGVQGGDMLQSFVSGVLSSIVSSAWAGGDKGKGTEWKGVGGNFARKDVGILVFGTAAGAGGAALTKLTGGNFLKGVVTGLVVSGLNHAAHDNDDNVHINSKDKTATVERTGDDYDRIFVDGKEIMATPRGALGPELRGAGYDISMKGPQGVGMGLTDFVLDAFSLITGATELKMGVTMLSKSSLGLKVGLGGSKGTLQSSVFYTKTLGINAKMRSQYIMFDHL